jgi:galactokinase
VLPVALEKKAVIVGVGSIVDINDKDSNCSVVSCGMEGGVVSFDADPSVIAPSKENAWTNYVKGVVKQYSKEIPTGKKISFKAAYNTDVPLGAGLSSSAALEVVTATFLEQLEGIVTPSKEEKAVRCQSAEHEFCDMPCGIMDQFISALGTTGHALMIDCRSNVGTNVKMASTDVVILVSNSNVKHQLTGSEYPTRVRQCQEATDQIAKKYPEVKQLRDANMDMLMSVNNESELDPDVFKRARHVIGENDRVLVAVKALESGDFKTAGELMVQSHNSLRDDFEVSCPELDVLVDIANKYPGVYGSRMTGGGFGGCTVTLVDAAVADDLMNHIKLLYSESTKLKADCFVTRPGNGASPVVL